MPTHYKNASSSLAAEFQLDQLTAMATPPAPNKNAVVVGLYGIPGSGKTFLLNQLKQELGQERFAFYEGSKIIATLTPGGLEGFRKLEEQEKMHWRQLAIDKIGKECADRGLVAVVAGHFMFWTEEEEAGRRVYTQNDLNIFTHILYLDVPAEVVAQRRLHDLQRSRPSASATHLHKWQQAEKVELRCLCRNHNILFSLVSPQPTVLSRALPLLRDFSIHTEKHNLSCAEARLDEALFNGRAQLETVLVMDADRTLTADDTGVLFWKRVSDDRWPIEEAHPLEMLFSSSLGYSYIAFRQATLLYEETMDDQEFDAICQDVASAVTIHPEFVSLLQLVAEQKHVGVVIVSCGLRLIWEKVLDREGLSKTVKVIGGGRIADGFVVTAAVKAALVGRLRCAHKTYVWAFGDSPLDLEMLRNADQAIVVVGETETRSKTMDVALLNAVDNGGLRAYQALLPGYASPRLDTNKLPLIRLTEYEFICSILRRRNRDAGLQVLQATDRNAAKLLMTPMRDAHFAGPILRDAHRRVGWYLATEFLGDVIGIEEYAIPHVQGHHTTGYQLLDEPKTSIVALMRGGEAMAFGVNEAFPLSMFIHAGHPADIKDHHLQGQSALVLVDSVVNSGKTVLQFVEHIRNICSTIRIVVITGVAQTQSILYLDRSFASYAAISLIALRLSDNKFTGRGTTDTGNRLFNTTQLR